MKVSTGDLVIVEGSLYRDEALQTQMNCSLSRESIAVVVSSVEKPLRQYRVFVEGVYGWVGAAQVVTCLDRASGLP